MAVIVQYIVERNGIQKMTFDNKKEADAYDKELEISEDMSILLEKSGVTIDDKQMEELCLYLARNKEDAMAILKGSKPKDDTSTKPKKAKTPSETKKDEVKNTDSSNNSDKSADSNKNKEKAA